MTLLIDPPSWPGRGRLWSHLVSDTSVEELHEFASLAGIPARGFERDHYDVPAEVYHALVGAGARPVSSREVVAALAVAGLRRRKSESSAARRPGRELVRPRRLQVGDTIGVVAPAGPVPRARLDKGIEVLESFKLRVRLGRHVLSGDSAVSYLAGSDEQRAADFEACWVDPEVRAVIMARGGYGCQRMIGHIDWRALRNAEPKVLVGFSDLTALQHAVASHLGLVTLHGPGVTSLADVVDGDSVESLRRTLLEPESSMGSLASTAEAVVPGVAEGVLTGGNVALLAAGVGTPEHRPAAGCIAVLEDVGEEPFRLDRQLTQLLRAGWFQGVRGLALGTFESCGDAELVESVLAERLGSLGAPMVMGLPFGHGSRNLAIPLGVRARLDAGAGTLTPLTPGLR
ncbi:MAG: DUF4031 domain-containing protein [Nocardioidaceae bacterium]